MHRLFIAAVAVLFGMVSAAQADDLIRVESPHSVAVTADRLVGAVEGAGATVFARIDHAAGAAKVDAELDPTVVVIFGNPKMGTPLMQAQQTMGLDLPIKVLVMEEGGTTYLVYRDPAALAALHNVPADHPVLAKMTGALGKLTGRAAAAE